MVSSERRSEEGRSRLREWKALAEPFLRMEDGRGESRERHLHPTSEPPPGAHEADGSECSEGPAHRHPETYSGHEHRFREARERVRGLHARSQERRDRGQTVALRT